MMKQQTVLQRWTFCAAIVAASSFVEHLVAPAGAGEFSTPDILVIGDSQLSFGSGKVMLDFFRNFDRHCTPIVKDRMTLDKIGAMRTTMIGARSTSLQSWVTTKGPAWRRLCVKDKTWGVNASVWGHNASPSRLYHQIGEGTNYQFCKRHTSPLKAMLKRGYYQPKLAFFYLIGNGSGRLANNKTAARNDVAQLVQQLPMDTKCVYMTTTPIHTPRRNRTRIRAQENLRAAFKAHGNRCSFVSALRPDAVAAIQGKGKYFRRNKRGGVKDPFHPNDIATRIFLDLNKPALCRAVASELKVPMVVAVAP